MRICIFGAASNEIDKNYIEKTEQFGLELAKRGHELVFGAGGHGLMGAAARGVKTGGGRITGVIPEFFRDETIEVIYDKCNELIYTKTMRERKAIMEDKADAFIIVPGGIGTFEEFFEILTLKQLGRHTKPIAIYNIDGYFDHLEKMIEVATEQHFVRKECRKIYGTFDNPEDVISYIENDECIKHSISELKNG